MIKTRYNNQPEPLRVQRMGDFFDVTVTANARHIDDGAEQYWEADANSFTVRVGEIDLADLRARPENYVDYIPAAGREAIKTARIAAIQDWMDKTAQAHGYDNIFTACTYATSTDPTFRAEGQACVAWRDAVWVAANRLAADVMAGGTELPDVATMLAQLPQIEWPILNN